MNIKTKVMIVAGLLMMTSNVSAIEHKVAPGDTPWAISQKYKVELSKILSNNNLTKDSIIISGQVLHISGGKEINNIPIKDVVNNSTKTHTVVTGDTPWTISQKYKIEFNKLLSNNNLTMNSIIIPGQILYISGENHTNNTSNENSVSSSPRKHLVTSGDTLWKISQKQLVTIQDIIISNPGLTKFTELKIGQILNIPNEFIIQTKTDGKHGANLDWWTQVNRALPIGATFKVIDYHTGKSFNIKRTIGANHADVEPLTKADTDIMKSIWGGFTWTTRPTIVEYKGMRIASSMSFMPHAGNDIGPGGVHTNWRSGNYGAGPNLDYIKGNGMDGHLDLYFRNSTRHVDGKVDLSHQKSINIAAGIK